MKIFCFYTTNSFRSLQSTAMMAKIPFCCIMQRMKITFFYWTHCKKCDVAIFHLILSRVERFLRMHLKQKTAQVKLCEDRQAVTVPPCLLPRPGGKHLFNPLCENYPETEPHDGFIFDRASLQALCSSVGPACREELCCKLQTCSVSIRLKVRLD